MSKKKSRFRKGFGVAMFLDAQNISSMTANQIYALLCYAASKFGYVDNKQIYADSENFDRGGEKFFCSLGFEWHNIPGSRFDKNRADRELINDCHQYVQEHPQTKVIFLGSQDGDFAELAQDLKEKGRQVIVVASSRKVSEKLSSFEIIYLDELEQLLSFPVAA